MKINLRVVYRFISYYTPKFLKAKIKNYADKKEMKIALDRAKRTKVKKEDVISIFDRLDFSGDVFLHTSIMNVGKVEGGVKFLVNVLKERIVDEGHTLLVSALPYRGVFKDYLEKEPVFDVRTAPIAMGAINEKLALLEGAKRSIHPTHSVVAIGDKAEYYVSEHHLDETPFNTHSPYYKLLQNEGKILLLGARLNNVTYIHVIEDLLEDLFPIKCYYKKKYIVKCIDEKGRELCVKTRCHDSFMGIFRDSMILYEGMKRTGVFESYPFGESEVILIDVKKYTLYYLNMLQQGQSIYGRHKVTKELKIQIDKIITNLTTN